MLTEKIDERLTLIPEEGIEKYGFPTQFNYPFYYIPDELTRFAADELKDYLKNDLKLNLKRGKMFGILIVKGKNGRIGYLSAFSGKLEGENDYDKFVPPVFDMLTQGGFFREGEKEISEINERIKTLESNDDFLKKKEELKFKIKESEENLADFKEFMKANKQKRREVRESQKEVLPEEEYSQLENVLNRQSNYDRFRHRILKKSWKQALEYLDNKVKTYSSEIESLKNERKEKSNALQNKLFDNYSFLNSKGEIKNLNSIFKETNFEKPPSGAGECTTPKLLQYAFLNELKPLAFAEFWWGPSPESEIRKHGNFYPACSGKCRPILKHMLWGMDVEENPLLKALPKHKVLKVIYEDEDLIVVNKPEGLLSIPGIEIQDSVCSRLQEKLKNIEPLIVHRLDRATSGIMVVAKTKSTHKHLQSQFTKKTVNKKYIAILSETPSQNGG